MKINPVIVAPTAKNELMAPTNKATVPCGSAALVIMSNKFAALLTMRVSANSAPRQAPITRWLASLQYSVKLALGGIAAPKQSVNLNAAFDAKFPKVRRLSIRSMLEATPRVRD